MGSSSITLQPVQAQDYKRLADLESNAFGDDEFAQIAFGPHRFDDDVLEARAKEMSKENRDPGEFVKYVKAIKIAEDGVEQIVGFSHWVTVRPSLGGVGVYGIGKDADEKAVESVEREELGADGKKVKTIANEKLCDDLFIPGDQYMAKACEGRDYHKLFNLIVDRGSQRQGIGSLLLRNGLEDADQGSLECVLGASLEGLDLYKKYGFVEFQKMTLDLKGYEGGEGMGIVQHWIMHRPARSRSVKDI